MSIEREYVLGTHDEEIERLRLQNAVWRPRATVAWRRAGFTAGQTLIDLGCGPGWATLDLAEVVGPSGRVVAIDRSRRFLGRLEAEVRARGLTQVETLELDLDVDEVPALEAHGIWSRWVYSFVRHPRVLLRRASKALRTGGTVAMHEYCDYRGWRTSPASEAFEGFVQDVIESWRESGGEPDIGMHLPGWLGELGFDVRHLEAISEVTRRGDFTWQWPLAFVETGLQRLVDLGRVDAERARRITEDYRRVLSDPFGFQITPMVLEIVAVRS
jgi:SAM-dependent methyltransferase